MFKHLDRKYFRFRAPAVAFARAKYPARARVLLLSELLRLGFVGFGALLCAAIFAVLTAGAYARVGAADWRTVVFALLALYPAVIFLRILAEAVSVPRALRTASSRLPKEREHLEAIYRDEGPPPNAIA